jgi:AcrR family transcriptional regulator
MARARPADLREACLQEAFRIIGERGVEGLSLREVARRLGVSHQAPYRHFASRDHILAACVARAYQEFAAALEDRPRDHDPGRDLHNMGEAYLAYARAEPLKYRLMFGTTLPPPSEHPEMMANARRAFALLHEAIGQLGGRTGRTVSKDAVFVWAAIHGLATIMHSEAVHTLNLESGAGEQLEPHLLARLSRALAGD